MSDDPSKKSPASAVWRLAAPENAPCFSVLGPMWWVNGQWQSYSPGDIITINDQKPIISCTD